MTMMMSVVTQTVDKTTVRVRPVLVLVPGTSLHADVHARKNGERQNNKRRKSNNTVPYEYRIEYPIETNGTIK